jgi:hypothetical protein
MSKKASNNIVIKLPRVRLSFPSLFQQTKYDEKSKSKYCATFILDKVMHAATIKEIQKAIATLLADNKVTKLSPDRIALKDGDESDREENHGKYIIKASSDKRPLVINRDKTPITETDEIVYAGCYVHGIISLWFQNDPQHPEWGKKINAALSGVQFASDGEPFSAGGASVDDFDAFGDEEDEGDISF